MSRDILRIDIVLPENVTRKQFLINLLENPEEFIEDCLMDNNGAIKFIDDYQGELGEEDKECTYDE